MSSGFSNIGYGEVKEFTEKYQFPVMESKILTEGGVEVPNRRAIVRGDTNEVVGTVGSNYKVLSHSDALDPIIDRLKEKGQRTFKRILLANNGAKMFASIYFPHKEASVGNSGDKYWPGITVVNSLDGTLRYHLEASIFRLVCTNGMRVPQIIKNLTSVHSKNKDYTEMVEGIIGVVDGDQFTNFNKWANKDLGARTSVDLNKLVDYVINNPKVNFPAKYKPLVECEISRELENGPMTVWSLYNAFHSVIEHHLVREKGKYNRARSLDENLYKFFSTESIF